MTEAKKPTQVRQTQIVGNSYRPDTARTWLAKLAPKQPLQLRREPNNKYDPNAVMVYIFEQHLGYIPRGLAAEIAPLMDKGLKAGARKAIGQAGNGIIDIAWEYEPEPGAGDDPTA